MSENSLLTTEQVAAWLNCDKETVRRLARDGRLEAYRVGREFRFHPDAVKTYLGTQLVKGSDDKRIA